MLLVICTLSVSAAADELTCPLRGEILSAQDYSKVFIYAQGDLRSPRPASPYAPLYAGDVVRVTGSQSVIIRNKPRSTQTINEASGEFRIDPSRSCDSGREWWDVVSKIGPVIARWANGPIQAEPRVTMPRGGDVAKLDLSTPFSKVSYLVAGASELSLLWQGRVERVSLEAEDGSTLLSLKTSGRMHAEGRLTRPLGQGEILKLRLVGDEKTETSEIHVRPVSDLPFPKPMSVGTLLSPDAEELYAIWLTLKGPIEWRPEALRRLGQSSRTQYMAWKIWSSLLANGF